MVGFVLAAMVFAMMALTLVVGMCTAIALYETLNQADARAVRLNGAGVVGAVRCVAIEVLAIAGCALLRLVRPVARWRRPPAVLESLPPLVLVHGWGTSAACWTLAADRLRHAGWPHVDAIEYRARRDGFEGAAAILRDHVDLLRRETGAARVVLVAHGIGGIVCRLYLRALAEPGVVAKLVTLATPHQGNKLCALAGDEVLGQLRDGSTLLDELAVPAAGERSVEVTAIASSFDPFVIPAARAHLPGGGNITVEGVGHFGMLWSSRVLALVDENLRHDL